MIRTVTMDTTPCTLDDTTSFNYRTDKTIASPTDYIKGIDCQTGVQKTFSKFYIQYKRALKNKSPSQQQYLSSQTVTVWTVYPQR
jgi:hypothetical protein